MTDFIASRTLSSRSARASQGLVTLSNDTNALMGIITVHEKKVWEALISGDRTADDALLSDRFLGVYPDGFASKQDH